MWPRGIGGWGDSSSSPASAGSPVTVSATPRAWSKRTSSSGTTKRVTGKPLPAGGSGTVGSSSATMS